jgi:hypothetical protein
MSLPLFRILLLALLLGSVSPAAGRQFIHVPSPERFSGIKIEAGMPFSQVPPTGFCPLYLKIENSTDRSHSWNLSVSSSFGGPGQPSTKWTTKLTVAARQTGEFDLMIPRPSLESDHGWYEMLQCRLEGYGVRQGTFVLPSHYPGGVNTAYVLMSESLANAVWSKVEAEVKTAAASQPPVPELGASRPGLGGGRALSGARIDPQELPPDWRALSGVSGFWLRKDEWEKLSADCRRAVRQWVSAGGHLFVVSPEDSLTKLPLLPPELAAAKPVTIGFGSVQAVKLKAGELPVPETASAIVRLNCEPFPAWNADYKKWGLLKTLGYPHMNVPLIVAFVCLFAVVIGPINLRVLAPPARRSRLFLTTPILSILASVFLFGVIAFGDGFGGSGYRNSLVYLPSGESLAVVAQEQLSRSRLLFSRQFSIPEDAQLSFAQHGGNTNKRMTFERSGKLAAGDWFQSRAVQAHTIRAVVPSRAEVILQNAGAGADEKPVLLSSVAGRLKDVFYVDSAGKYWRTAEMNTGTPVTLEPAAADEWGEWISRNTADFSVQLRAATTVVQSRPGHFYAVADKLPEAPIPTISGFSWLNDRVLCFGPCQKGDR